MSIISLIKKNPHPAMTWEDEIYDDVNNVLLAPGTPFLAEYINRIEDNIELSFDYIMELQRATQQLIAKQALADRAPGNSGMILDTFDGSETQLDTAGAVSLAPVSALATTITVDDASTIKPFTEITIFDDNNVEDVLVTAVTGNVITVQALTYNYKKGARIVRSAVSIDTTAQKMLVAPWRTYTVQVTAIV